MTESCEHPVINEDMYRQLDKLSDIMPYADARRALGMPDEDQELQQTPTIPASPASTALLGRLPTAREILDQSASEKGEGYRFSIEMRDAFRRGDKVKIQELLRDHPQASAEADEVA
jgi:hypothetical protein